MVASVTGPRGSGSTAAIMPIAGRIVELRCYARRMQARVIAVTAAAILLVLSACGTPPVETTSLTPTTTALDDAASLEANRLFASPQQCELTLAGHLVGITFPGAWSTNDAVEGEGGIPACLWFGPDDLVITDPLTQAPEGVAIGVGSVGGPAVFHREWISLEETTIAGRPAWRVEESVPSPNNADEETLQLVYWVSLGATSTDGPTLVARTATEEAGNYALNKAVLDRMMASLTVR